jgi:hypothetical protein
LDNTEFHGLCTIVEGKVVEQQRFELPRAKIDYLHKAKTNSYDKHSPERNATYAGCFNHPACYFTFPHLGCSDFAPDIKTAFDSNQITCPRSA